MKVDPREVVQGYITFFKFILLLPVMSIFLVGYYAIALFLTDLITGNGLEHITMLLWAVPLSGLFAFVCMRKEWYMLYIGGVLVSTFSIMTDDANHIITKVIMVAVTVALLILPYALNNPRRAAAKATKQFKTKPVKVTRAPKAEKKIRVTPEQREAIRRETDARNAPRREEFLKQGKKLDIWMHNPNIKTNWAPCGELTEEAVLYSKWNKGQLLATFSLEDGLWYLNLKENVTAKVNGIHEREKCTVLFSDVEIDSRVYGNKIPIFHKDCISINEGGLHNYTLQFLSQ